MGVRRVVILAISAVCYLNPATQFRHIVIDRANPLRPHCKTVADLNGDRFPDVLAASSAGGGLFWYAWPSWSKHRIDTGSFTTDMQAGDIDGDGDADVIIPRTGTGLVWYENPRPKFRATFEGWRMHRIDAEGAHDVEVGDIDGDRKLDVVVRHKTTRVFFQRTPDEWTRIEIETGGRSGTALGDLDGDGDLDIVQNGYWLETPKDKQQRWVRRDIAGGWPDDVAVHVADLNGDGRADVLLAPAETCGRLVWYESADPIKGPWTEHVIAEDVCHVHTFKTADVDKDGDLDVVFGEMEQSPQRRIAICVNQGKGLKWHLEVIGRSGTHNLRVADIGNDGDLDIVGANHGNYGVDTPIEYWENISLNPSPPLALNRWQRHVIDWDRPERAAFILAADLTDDGKPEIVVGPVFYLNPGGAVIARATRGGGLLWDRIEIGEPLTDAVTVYDFDGDGAVDILGLAETGAKTGPKMVWAQREREGSFIVHPNIGTGDVDVSSVCGAAPLRWRLGERIRVALSLKNPGTGIQMLTIPKDPVKESWRIEKISHVSQNGALSVADVGRDVRLDLLLGTKWLRNEAAAWTEHTLNPAHGVPDRNRFADVNGDGLPDAVLAFRAPNRPGKVAWYEHPARLGGTWTEHIVSSRIVDPASLDVADLDRDGDVDIVIGEHDTKSPDAAKLLIFENVDGKGLRWRRHVVYTGDEHFHGAVVVDIDGDGDLDIISKGSTHRHVLLYENTALSR
jgi:hypothetical protein